MTVTKFFWLKDLYSLAEIFIIMQNNYVKNKFVKRSVFCVDKAFKLKPMFNWPGCDQREKYAHLLIVMFCCIGWLLMIDALSFAGIKWATTTLRKQITALSLAVIQQLLTHGLGDIQVLRRHVWPTSSSNSSKWFSLSLKSQRRENSYLICTLLNIFTNFRSR